MALSTEQKHERWVLRKKEEMSRRTQFHETVRYLGGTIVPPVIDIGRTLAQGTMNVLTGMAQSSAGSPIIATGATIIIADMLQKFGVITPGGSALAIMGVTGLAAADVAAGIIDSILTDVPFTQPAQTTATNITIHFDIPDLSLPVRVQEPPPELSAMAEFLRKLETNHSKD